jgi:hypothetical protein
MKNKTIIFVVGGLFLVLVVLLFIFMGTPKKTDTEQLKPVDWSSNFNPENEGPYGTRVFHDIILHYFDSEKKHLQYDYDQHGLDSIPMKNAFIFYVAEEIDSDKKGMHDLMRFIEKGNYALIAAETFKGPLADLLLKYFSFYGDYKKEIQLYFREDSLVEFYDQQLYTFPFFDEGEPSQHNWILLEQRRNPPVRPVEEILTPEQEEVFEDPIEINEESVYEETEYSEYSDSEETVETQDTVEEDLPISWMDEYNMSEIVLHEFSLDGYAVLVEIKYGKGSLFIHTNPYVFTNLALLFEINVEHAEKMLSLFPDLTLVTLEREYSPMNFSSSTGEGNGDSDGNSGKKTSPLQFILSVPALAWAYYLMLAGVFLFLFFYLKRRFRPIPAKEKISNNTMDFAQTLTQLYYQSGRHQTIIQHKERLFYAFVRDRYFMNAHKKDEQAIRMLSLKSGISEEHIKGMINTFDQLSPKIEIIQQELFDLQSKTDYFYKNCK